MQPLRFKSFQKDDLARSACRNGAILAWEPGLGKGLAAFAWPLIKEARRTLIVAPAGLHLQLRETAREFFGINVLPVENQEQFFQWRLDRACVAAKPLFFITSYEAVGYNGADEWEIGEDEEVNRLIARRRSAWCVEHGVAEAPELWSGIGEERKDITCVRTPSLARLVRCYDSFDCIVIDEGTRLQSNDAHIANAVRLTNPRYRLVLTGTPIKNRLESLFWLAWWAVGGTAAANARWPYEGTTRERERFANEHLQRDTFLTRERRQLDASGRRQTIARRSARITNLHHLWKVLAPVIIRRLKSDCGEDIAPRVIKPVSVPPGLRQNEIYRHHLDFRPNVTDHGRADAAVQVNRLRMAALCPYADGLGEVRSENDLTPKTDAILRIIAECLARGEQCVVGSAFTDFSKALNFRLREAGVASVVLDGSVDANKRADLSRDFKRRRYSVVIAGIKAMGEGNSWECCNNLILPSLDWAFDINDQFINRVWRLNSPRTVNIYTVTMKDSIDEQLSELFREKTESSQLALDGCLQEETVEEVLLSQLLATARKRGQKAATITTDEDELRNAWPTLRTALRNAQNTFWGSQAAA